MSRRKKRRKQHHFLFWFIFLEVLLVIGGLGYLILNQKDHDLEKLINQDVKIDYIEETNKETEKPIDVPRPEVDEQLLTPNPYSRPGKMIKSVDKIVVHYLGNPKTSAQQNHDYFESLKDLGKSSGVSMSANYVIGLEGEIIQCVPEDEVAYASNDMNSYSISIENCHKDKTGKLNEATYDSLVKMLAYLTEKYNLGRDDIIRHYDITGKDCPKYYVDHEDLWEKLKDDVMEYRNACKEAAEKKRQEAAAKETEPPVDELTAYLEEFARQEKLQGDL